MHPRYAIVSVGRHKLFGHPAPQTIDTLQESDARVYRTDQNGAVTITSTGGPANITTMIRVAATSTP